ncbi:hypothetical protein WDU94_013867 [Cyamophila willieti]
MNLIDEGQAGFREGRSCTDNLFTLYAILSINTKQPREKVFACFVDFRRCFDSVPHSLLWNHLHNIGVSSHLIRTIKSIYDKAKVSVRNCQETNRTSEGIHLNKVALNIGLLQGDGLSPLLYLLFVSDLIQYFETRGIEGVRINAETRVIALMYADDLVLLANSDIMLQKMLDTFSAYCKEKELTVNTEKTNVMIFRRKGRVSPRYRFLFDDEEIKIVSTYLYLGVLFTSQFCFRENAKRAIDKASKATVVTNSLWARTGVHSWENRTTLYQAIVKSTLLYAVEVWGPRYQELLEKAQVNYFKKLLFWPRNTPNYILRRETGAEKLSTDIFEKMLKWWEKILRMPEYRYPKLCLQELKRLEFFQPLDTEHNWAAQLREELLKAGRENLYHSEDPEEIKSEMESLITTHRNQTIEEDTRRIRNSNYSDLYQELTTGVDTEKYLTFDLEMEKIRTVSQLRVAPMKEIRIYTNGCTYIVNTEEICSICSLGEGETLAHILLRCPLYGETRAAIAHYTQDHQEERDALKCLLTYDTKEKLKTIYHTLITILKIRAFIMFE